jgi:hypothetical protein
MMDGCQFLVKCDGNRTQKAGISLAAVFSKSIYPSTSHAQTVLYEMIYVS